MTQQQQVDYVNSLRNNFPGLYDYYTRYKWNSNTPNNAQHQQMAAHYRSTIAGVLAEFDNNQHSYQFYMDLAWEGLNHSNIEARNSRTTFKKYYS